MIDTKRLINGTTADNVQNEVLKEIIKGGLGGGSAHKTIVKELASGTFAIGSVIEIEENFTDYDEIVFVLAVGTDYAEYRFLRDSLLLGRTATGGYSGNICGLYGGVFLTVKLQDEETKITVTNGQGMSVAKVYGVKY